MVEKSKWLKTDLGPGDTQETDTHEHTSDRHLIIPELDSIEILHRERVGGDQTIQS